MSAIIQLDQVSFSYGQTRPLINIPNLEVKRDEKLFIHGPSGSGKSTFLKLIAGLLPTGTGVISVLDRNISRLSSSERDRLRADHIGFIFQDFNLISYLSVYENILLALKASSRRRTRIKQDATSEIHRLAEHLNIADHLKKPISQLSMGQQQRTAVARALLGGPEIVIADEPTSALDEHNATRFMELLIKEHSESPFALIFVSHDKRLTSWFDRQISLKELMT